MKLHRMLWQYPARCFNIACSIAVLSHPAGAILAQQTKYDLLVSNNEAHSVFRYDAETGAFVDAFVPAGAGGLNQTQEVLIGHDGSLLVAGIGTGAILKFHARTGVFLGAFTSGYTLQGPTKTRFGPDGHLYVSQWGSTQTSVAVFDGTTGVFVREATPNLDRPMGQAWDAQGVLHVASFGTADIRSFDSAGNQIAVVVAGGLLQGPVNIWFEGNEMMVIDWTSGTIQRYAGDGTHLDVFASGLTNPEGWDYGPDGALYIAEWTNDRVRSLDPSTGAVLSVFASGNGLQSPNDVLFVERLPDFALAATVDTVRVSAGAQSTVAVDVLPQRGVAFDASVALNCSTVSANITCNIDPRSVTPGSDTVSVNVTVSAASTAAQSRSGTRIGMAGGLAVLLVVTVAFGFGRSRRSRSLLWSAVGAAGTLAVVSCSDPVNPPPPPAATVVQTVVTGEGDGLIRTTSFMVEVQ